MALRLWGALSVINTSGSALGPALSGFARQASRHGTVPPGAVTIGARALGEAALRVTPGEVGLLSGTLTLQSSLQITGQSARLAPE